jgi:Flp pilus assembly protein TadD
MNRFATRFAASSLVIAAAMVGCHSDSVVASASASTSERAYQQAGRFAEQAREAMQRGDAARALGLAERAVEMSPEDAGYRMLLADLYLRNGRFRSAETSYSDVLAIDPSSTRAGLNVALSQIAQGRSGDALVQLEQVSGSAPASDLGLAFALAGQPQRAIELLEPAARAQDANGRTRQNLALAHALAGDWERARTIAAQDVSPAELGPRLQHWASLAQPSASHNAVATLLGVTPAADPGQPVRLALAQPAPAPVAFAAAEPVPEPVQIAAASDEAPVEVAETQAVVPVQEPIQYAEAIVVPAAEPVAEVASPAVPAPVAQQPVRTASWWPTPARSPVPAEAEAAPEAAPVTPEVRYAAAMRTLSAPSPVLSRAPATVARATRPTFRPAPIHRVAAITARVPRLGSGTGRFVVQLGAFANPQNAERAWAQASRRFGFASAEPRTARITVGGRTLTRVSIAGFSSRTDAVRLCSSIQSRGGSCFVRAVAGDTAVRWASAGTRARGA